MRVSWVEASELVHNTMEGPKEHSLRFLLLDSSLLIRWFSRVENLEYLWGPSTPVRMDDMHRKQGCKCINQTNYSFDNRFEFGSFNK
jgi:hypothetical protein